MPKYDAKVERFHKADEIEFYRLLAYRNDADLDAKLTEWEFFYNCEDFHSAMNEKTPHERLREKSGYNAPVSMKPFSQV
ncbi:hypothetical protein [Nitrosomonas sp.]|uniref:hypothetical protein n=1 Tax=Nitrosomonas sp. TaxID=42353 RepID=UPI0035B3F388